MASPNSRYKKRLVLDQNGRCFYCHLQLRDDVTLEHLKAKKLGGGNNYANFRAAHAKCNSGVGHLPVEVKLRLHHIGRTEGSDAFFLELSRIREVSKRARRKKKSELKKQRQAEIMDEYAYLERPSYRDAIWRAAA